METTTYFHQFWEQEQERERQEEEPQQQQSYETSPENHFIFQCEECEVLDSIWIENGMYVCKECGIIYGNYIDSSAEWRYYGNEDTRGSDPCRCGISSNYLIPESNMGTLIGYKRSESYTMKKIRQYHTWSIMNYKGRNLYNQFELLNIRCEKHGIPAIISEHTKLLYKKITEQQLFRGENKNGLMAICMYKACKDKNVPRSIKEIAKMFDVDEQIMTKGNRCFNKVWNLLQEPIRCAITETAIIELTKPRHYVERFCSRLQIQEEVTRFVYSLCEIIENHHLIADNTPSSICTAAILLGCQLQYLKYSKMDISNVSQISEVTIGKCYKKLLVYKDFLLQEIKKSEGTKDNR